MLGAVSALGDGTIDAAEDAAPPSRTLTTELSPGWNLSVWLGPPSHVSEIVRAIPALVRAVVWDPDLRQYLSLAPGVSAGGGVTQLEPGMSLWLYLGGTAAVEWTRPVYEDDRLVSLRRGLNLVGWTGRADVPIEQAVAGLGVAVRSVAIWDPASQAYERYPLGAAGDDPQLLRLHHGDAFWLEMSHATFWWQPGTAPTPVLVFAGDGPPEQELEIRAEFASLEAFFSERFGAGPADYSARIRTVRGDVPPYPCLLDMPGAARLVMQPCRDPLHAYLGAFHFWTLRERIAPREYPYTPGPDGLHPHGPRWLRVGARLYAEYAYLDAVDAERGRELRDRYISYASWTGESLREIEAPTGTIRGGWEARGFFAAEWLAERAGAAALLDYYRALASSRDWRHAFERSFGLDVERFYALAEEHIDRVAPPLPHHADERDEPVLVLLGDIMPAAAAAVRQDFERAQFFFGERLGASEADYTAFVAADDASAGEAFQQASARAATPGFCYRASQSNALVMTIDCGTPLREYLGRYHYLNVLGAIGLATDYPHIGPRWLQIGMERFAEEGYRSVAAGETLETVRERLLSGTRHLALTLGDLEAGRAAGTPAATELSHLAVSWLAERAGERTLVEYLRRRSAADPWSQTFEATFGLSVAEFHEEFAAFRSGASSAPR